MKKKEPLTTTQEQRDEFDNQFYQAIDKGFRPDELDRHGDTVAAISNSNNSTETKLERLVRERKERVA